MLGNPEQIKKLRVILQKITQTPLSHPLYPFRVCRVLSNIKFKTVSLSPDSNISLSILGPFVGNRSTPSYLDLRRYSIFIRR